MLISTCSEKLPYLFLHRDYCVSIPSKTYKSSTKTQKSIQISQKIPHSSLSTTQTDFFRPSLRNQISALGIDAPIFVDTTAFERPDEKPSTGIATKLIKWARQNKGSLKSLPEELQNTEIGNTFYTSHFGLYFFQHSSVLVVTTNDLHQFLDETDFTDPERAMLLEIHSSDVLEGFSSILMSSGHKNNADQTILSILHRQGYGRGESVLRKREIFKTLSPTS